MFELRRICLIHWYLFDAEEINIKGATAFVGASGAGKSSILDAIQTVITGNNKRHLKLNASASDKSSRSVYEYCVGAVDDIPNKRLRSEAETFITLSFQDTETDQKITIGISLYAPVDRKDVDLRARFILKDHFVTKNDFLDSSQNRTLDWFSFKEKIDDKHPGKLDIPSSKSSQFFVGEWLKQMRPRQNPDAQLVTKAFSNAVAFKPIDNTTNFVRQYLLEDDPLDVGRVRSSLETWKLLDETIQRLTNQIADLKKNIYNRSIKWADRRYQYLSCNYKALKYDYLRATRLVEKYSSELSNINDKLNNIANAVSRFRKDEEICYEKLDNLKQKRSAISKGLSSSMEDTLRAEKAILETALKDIEGLESKIRKISNLEVATYFLPSTLQDPIKEAKSLVGKFSLNNVADSIFENRTQVSRIILSVQAKEGLAENLRKQQRDYDVQLSDVEDKLNSKKEYMPTSEGEILSQKTRRFKALLKEEGIEARALPELIDEVDPKWAYALESILGPGREAIFVNASDIDQTFSILFNHRNELSGCRIARTDRLSEKDAYNIHPRSIANVVKVTDNRALAYINNSVGHYKQTADETSLNRENNGIMPNGKTSNNVNLRVFTSNIRMLFGKIAAKEAYEEELKEIKQLEEARDELSQKVKLLNIAQRLVTEISAELLEAKDIDEKIDAYYKANKKYKDIASSYSDNLTPEESSLAAEIEEAQKEFGEIKEQLNELDKEKDKEVSLKGDVTSKLSKHQEEQNKIQKDLDDLCLVHIDTDDFQTFLQLLKKENVENKEHFKRACLNDIEQSFSEEKDFVTICFNSAKSLREQAVDHDSQIRHLKSQIRSAYQTYSLNYPDNVPKGGLSEMMDFLVWSDQQMEILEGNQLLGYKEQAKKAREEMQLALREDLLTKLYERLGRVHSDLRVITTELQKHTFLDQKFRFKSEKEAAFSPLIALSKDVAENPDTAAEIMKDPKHEEALASLESLLFNDNALTTLGDYRNYYSFKLFMRSKDKKDDDDHADTDLDERISKASGGETQVPFYVAIGASLRSAYYPGGVSGDNRGFGLAMFDEALNKTDVINTQNVVNYYKSFGLQLLVAVPEDKSPTFLEVVDTIINISRNRGETVAYTDPEYLTPYAKEQLGAINPERIGFEVFKKTFMEQENA